MTPDPISPTTARPATAQPAAATRADVLSSDFQTFLLMLTTQMENQDPLNPVEASDFAVQLATFSGVEQQVRTNDLLSEIAGGLGATGLGRLAGWVGMEARVEAPAYFDGAALTLAPDPDPASDAATLVVRDASGRVVSETPVPLSGGPLDWAGTDAGGAPLPPGLYDFELMSLNAGEVTSLRPVAHYAKVTEARTAADGVEIVLQGGVTVPSGDVIALRQPD